jgi:NAD(P)-dependent dehydrogenase (short-subunit alcohol dehydrogenase family)
VAVELLPGRRVPHVGSLGKVIVITGAARGLGRALAAGLAAEGQVAAAAAAIDERWGRVDALINNAGWLPESTSLLDLDVLRRAVDSNLVSCFLTTKHFAPVMLRNGGGRIIHISSMIGVQANPGQAPYGVTKAGVNVLSNVVHRELADHGIRTVALAPGLTDTAGMQASVDDAYINRISTGYPGGRLGQPDDVVSFAAFLCSDAAQRSYPPARSPADPCPVPHAGAEAVRAPQWAASSQERPKPTETSIGTSSG